MTEEKGIAYREKLTLTEQIVSNREVLGVEGVINIGYRTFTYGRSNTSL